MVTVPAAGLSSCAHRTRHPLGPIPSNGWTGRSAEGKPE